MATVAILIPAMRPHNLPGVVASVAETTNDYNIVVVATGECAEVAKTLPVTLLEDEGGSYPVRINRAFRETAEPYLFLGADDIWHQPDWFENAMRLMDQVRGVVATNDRNNFAGVHFLVDRGYINELGGYRDGQGVVFYEGFHHQYCDDSLRETAKRRGRFAFAMDAIVEHRREWGDPIYAMGEAAGSHDLNVYKENADLWQ